MKPAFTTGAGLCYNCCKRVAQSYPLRNWKAEGASPCLWVCILPQQLLLNIYKNRRISMTKNLFIQISQIDLSNIERESKKIILDGKRVKTKEDFLSVMEAAFSFSISCNGSLDAFMDYIRDLSWFEDSKIILIIKSQKYFLRNNNTLRKQIFQYFKEDILPFWEEGVLTEVVDGRCKKFTIYVVDEVTQGWMDCYKSEKDSWEIT